jgi:hypothetical protein
MFLKNNCQMVLIVVVLAGIAGFGFKGCSKEDRKNFEKNARTSVRIGAAAAQALDEEVKAYCRAELLKPESCEKAITRTEKIAQTAQRVDQFLKEHPKITPENRGELLDAADEIISELDALEAEGVIDFKDPENRRKFLLGLAIGRSSIRVARVAIEEIPAQPSPSPAESPAL